MSPSCWSKSAGMLPIGGRCPPFPDVAQRRASINRAGALLVPATSAPKYCSGAFRYAARDGNSDIAPLERRAGLRQRPALRAHALQRARDVRASEPSARALHALTAMCALSSLRRRGS